MPNPRQDAALIPGELYALRANAQIAQVEDPSKLPTRLVIFPWGDHDTPQGVFHVNEKTLSSLAANQKLTNFDRVCLDFNHNTVPGNPSYKGEPAPVAAYARPVCLAGEGIVYEDIEWTDDGKKFIGGGHYRDISPAVKRDKDNNVIFLHSAAVCRQGAVPDLILFSADSSTHTKPTKTKHTMDPKKLLCVILGLDPEKATDEEIEAAAQKAADEAKESKIDPEEKSEVATLSAEVKKLTGIVENDRKSREDAARQEVIALAASEGKVVPKGAEKLDIVDLKTLCADLPVTVELGKRTNITALAADGSSLEHKGVEDSVKNALGISDEEWKTHKA